MLTNYNFSDFNERKKYDRKKEHTSNPLTYVDLLKDELIELLYEKEMFDNLDEFLNPKY